MLIIISAGEKKNVSKMAEEEQGELGVGEQVEVWGNKGRCGGTRGGVGEQGEVWGNKGRCGGTRGGVGEQGEVWGNKGRCGGTRGGVGEQGEVKNEEIERSKKISTHLPSTKFPFWTKWLVELYHLIMHVFRVGNRTRPFAKQKDIFKNKALKFRSVKQSQV